MKILFIASECAPIAKVGGLGDIIGTLPKAIKELGIDVRIALPKYSIIEEEKYNFVLVAKEVKLKGETVNIFKGFLAESQVPIYLIENKRYFGENDIYFERTAFTDSFKEIERFLFFSKAILEIFPKIKWTPQIIHCHDWHTAILPVLLKLQPKNQKCKVKTLLTIHNLANQGKWNAKEILDFLGLKGNEIESLKVRDKNDDFNIFQQGILTADILNTVSPTYSREILTKEYGAGLNKELKTRKNSLCGILNGIDVDFFNPETDPNIKVNYSFKNFQKKIENKLKLQEIVGFPKNKNTPLIGFVNRLTSQKGVDLIIDIIPELVKMGIQLIILGVGLAGYEKKLGELEKKYPKNISSQIKFDPILAQRIYAGCDIFLMPSQFEPCGLGQMIALRYGTIPVVRRTGGLADTVKNKINGFVFEKYKSESLLGVLKEALKCYQKQKNWNEIVKRAMSGDFSWQKSALEYLKLYNKLVKTLKNY